LGRKHAAVVGGRRDEQEELFPESERSKRLQRDRESFCRSFEECVTRKVNQLTQSGEKVLHRIVRQAPEQTMMQRRSFEASLPVMSAQQGMHYTGIER
jgi:hypothetical protein